MSVNKVILIGNLGREPEIRYLDNNRVVANFSLATNEIYVDKNGEKHKQTEWFNIEMWDDQAKLAEKYFHKGTQIYVEGKLRTENWKDKEGIDRSKIKVRVQNFTMLGNKPSHENTETENKTPEKTIIHEETKANIHDVSGTDDLPF